MVVKTSSITPELVSHFEDHAESASISNHRSGRLVESWKVGEAVLMRYTFFVDADNCPSVDDVLTYLGKELQK